MSHVVIAEEVSTLDIQQAPVRAHSPLSNSAPSITVPLGTPLSVAARELILSTLEHCGGERKRTAEMLGICTKTLYNRLREYGIREPHAGREPHVIRESHASMGEVSQTQ